MEDFGAFVKAQREARGWSLREAADRVSITHTRLAEVERGRNYRTDNASRPSRELVVRMAEAYGLPVAILLAHAGYDDGEAASLTDMQRQVLMLFDTLTPERQAIALDILRAMGRTNGPESSSQPGE